jgi:CBS domain-containing protein
MAGSIGRRWHLRKQPHVRLTAGSLMTSPAVTIGSDAVIPAAARLITTNHISRLPVVDEKGKLVGIVNRRDLLSVFLRPDADIARDARQVLDELPVADPKEAIMAVKHGVVTLTGRMRPEGTKNRT